MVASTGGMSKIRNLQFDPKHENVTHASEAQGDPLDLLEESAGVRAVAEGPSSAHAVAHPAPVTRWNPES